jgi:hypothetical protein
MIFSGLNRFNNILTEEKDLKVQSNLNPYADELNLKKYNSLLEIKKDINEERKDNTYLNSRSINNILMNNPNNYLKFNSYTNYQNNELFHKNLNYELEKNKIRFQRDDNFNKQNLDDFLTKINQNGPKDNLDNEFNDEIEILKNKISQYEVSLENTKVQYQKQINFYVQQLSNYNTLITIISNFFKNISKKFIPNYNFNIPNIIIEPNNFVPLNQKDIEEKFNKIEEYISDLNSELNEYKEREKEHLTIDRNYDFDKNEIDKYIIQNNKIKETISNTNYNNIYSGENDFIFKNEILAKKVRSKSSSKPRLQLNKKINSNKNLFKNKNYKNDVKPAKRNNSYREKERNNNLDIIEYTTKNRKKSKATKNIPIKINKKSKSKKDMRKNQNYKY